MSTKRRGLGRGLDALLGVGEAELGERQATEDGLKHLPVDVIYRGKYQPRSDIHEDTLRELADSIRAQGVVQPIVVRPREQGGYEIIAGERRWRAAQLAGLHQVPCVVREVPDERAVAMALIENIQRENLNPIEEATALQRLITEFQLTHEEAAHAVGRSRAAVSNYLRLLTLDRDVKQLLLENRLEMGHARALLALDGSGQRSLARDIVAKGLSVRETERRVRRLAAGSTQAPARPRPVDPDIRRLQDSLSEKIGVPVRVLHGSDGRGRLIIRYSSVDELDGILQHIH